MPPDQASKPPSHKGFAPFVCAVLVTSAKLRPISNTSSLLLLSILYALWPGSMGMNWLPHASRLSNGFTLQLKKFPNSVKIGHEPTYQSNDRCPALHAGMAA